LLFAPACSSLPTPTPSTPQATIEITEIVDKTTLQPISHNKISLRWENVQGKLLETKELQDQTDLVTTLPADGKTFLTITVESPGYVTWTNRFRMKLDKDKRLSTPVEMSKKADSQS
jgi:hypothetical protein